jgi:hypothetical protein
VIWIPDNTAAMASLIAVCALASAEAAFAQSSASTNRRVQLDVGLVWTGGVSYGSSDANLTTPSGGAQALFSTSSLMSAGVGLETHLTFRVNGPLSGEVSGTWSHANLQTSVTGDLEGAAPSTLALGISRFGAEGSALWCFRRDGRVEPFLRGGAGWLRELTGAGTLSRDGLVGNLGGGVKYWWRKRDRGVLRGLGLRSEVRLAVRSGGLALGTKTVFVSPAAGVSLMVGF